MVRGLLILCILSLLGVPTFAQVSENEDSLSPRERASHLLSRLTFGARPGDLDRLLAMGEEAWLEEQLAATSDLALGDRLAKFESLVMEASDLSGTYSIRLGDDATPEEIRERNRLRNQPKRELLSAVFYSEFLGKNQLEQVMVDFWRNHLNVSFTKGGPANFLLVDWDRDVIREHALGSFPAMLHASAKHPAMLHYLDNASSRRPPSDQELREIERRTRRRTGSEERGEEAVQLALQRGLNENYARELMELHTLGVDNGYKQKDVIALAEVLTGWTYSGGRQGNWEFQYRPAMHVLGSQRILGKSYEAKRGQSSLVEGEAVLMDLAAKKGTAEYISTKLVRYLVHDDPPTKTIKAVSKAYRSSDGDVRAMLHAVFDSKEFWSRENYRAKFKTPLEFVVSALRAVDAEVADPQRLHAKLESMGQAIYHCDDPTGWSDTAEAWLDPGVMAVRWQFALDLAGNRIRGTAIPETYWDSVPPRLPPRLWQHHLTKEILPGGAGNRTRAALSTITDEYLTKARNPDILKLGPILVGLLLGSPEFQQQ